MLQARISGLLIGLLMILALGPLGRGSLADDGLSPADRFLLERSVLSSGGVYTMGPAWNGNGTLGQPMPAVEAAAGDRLLRTGFWAWLPGAAISSTVPQARPLGYGLFQNTPNPFRVSTRIDFALAREGLVALEVYDVKGRRVRTLLAESRGPGNHSAVWNGLDEGGREVSPGVYFYMLKADNQTTIRKMVLAR